MIVEKGRSYLDSLGRRFECRGFGERTGLAMGYAVDLRRKNRRHRPAGFDEQKGDVLGCTGTFLVCPWPDNDWTVVAYGEQRNRPTGGDAA
ncbi:hypothetical protein [Consotaella salsifontis]|uniref:Uncharacterized protein n=1 Tax=Consotaella salsifontis TaxID=1365950 RepID=A0A1T4SE71_9HYPH|nr:hypothetical protein [Consotaella salsifontis]SKA26436.1 hypothetical protein SAMN05428963_11078 [Consotaella salsifontis]